MPAPYFVRAECDPEAKVWVATSDDVPGLATEAETFKLLSVKLQDLVPELLKANGVVSNDETFLTRSWLGSST